MGSNGALKTIKYEKFSTVLNGDLGNSKYDWLIISLNNGLEIYNVRGL